MNSKFCFLSIDVLIFKIGWKFIRCKRVEWPKVLKRFVNFRPTVSRSWLLGLTSQEDGAEIISYYTLRLLTAMINTVLKFPYSKFCFNWTNISSFLAELLQWSVSNDVGGSPQSFVNKGPRWAAWQCSHQPPALGGMVRLICHIEISQTTIVQAYS